MNLLEERPRLRAVDIRQTTYENQACLVFRDPLQLVDGSLVLSELAGPVLALCDGTRNRIELQNDVMRQYGLQIDPATLGQLITALDNALLLDNTRFRAARAAAIEQYRAARHRPLTFADQIYPADLGELQAMFNAYLYGVDDVQPDASGRGVLSPHIDYARGGPVYAAVWKRAANWIRDIDLVVLLGTDHYGGRPFTLTRQSYATPYGVLPTNTAIVDALADALGPDALEDELLHVNEHSLELVATWLHHMRGGEPCELVPILCGSFARFTRGRAEPSADAQFNTLLEVLGQATQGRRVAVVASGDMAHVGPAFEGEPLDAVACADLEASDEELLRCMSAGDAEAYFRAIRNIGDANNICGLPPLYLALRLLGQTHGEHATYAQCPADDEQTSFVSISGMTFS